MVRHDLWDLWAYAGMQQEGFLCIGCLEQRPNFHRVRGSVAIAAASDPLSQRSFGHKVRL
jgi:hypothetical protein